MLIRPSYTLAIIKREMWQIIATKGFLAMLLIPFLIAMLMGGLIPLAEKMIEHAKQSRTDSVKIGVVSDNLTLLEQWRANLQDKKLDNGLPLFELSLISIPGLPDETIIQAAKEKLRKGELDAYVVFNGNILENGTSDFYSLRGFSIDLTGDLRWPLIQAVRNERLKDEGLDPDRVSHLTRGISWNEYEVKVEAASEGEDEVRKGGFEKQFAPAIISIMMMIFLTISTSQRLSRGIVEEKTSRVIEVLLSSVSSSELLFGKVFALYFIGMIQFVIWISIGMVVMQTNDIAVSDYMPPNFFGKYMFFLTTGYLFYASIFAALGALAGDETESQQVQGFVTIFIMLPVMFNFIFMTNPNWWPVRLICAIPFFTPTVMAIRMVVTDVPMWEVAALAFSTFCFAIVGIWLASRIYRIGILMTGKRPGIKEIWKWCVYSDSSFSIKR